MISGTYIVQDGGRYFNGLLSVAPSRLAAAKAFHTDLKSRAEAAGRSPRHLKVMPGVFPIVGRSADEAEEKYAQLQELVYPDGGMTLLSAMSIRN